MKIRITLAVLFLTLSACGGGGGGGSSSGSGRSAATGVRILHGVIDVAPVDLQSSAKAGEIISSASFAENTFYASLPEGDQTLTLSLHNNPADIHATSTINIENRKHYSLLYFGNELQIGVNAAVINDDAGSIPDGLAAIKIIHALIGAAQLNAGLSDGQSAESISFGGASPYLFVPAGPVTINISRASDGRRVASTNRELSAGNAYTLLMTGEIEFFTIARLLED